MISIFNDQPWVDEAACASADPEAFFPEKGGSTRDAKRVCASCTAQERCLEWALKHDERFGVLGGYSERERRRMKRGEILRPLPKPVERTETRCEWCRRRFIGEQMYCCASCSSSASRQVRRERVQAKAQEAC